MYRQVEHRVSVAREEAATVFRRLESKDKYWGRRPLWWAAENGHEAVVKLLLEQGAELEVSGVWGGANNRDQP